MIGCKNSSDDKPDIDTDENNITNIVTQAPTSTPAPTPIVENHDGEMRSYLSGLWVPIEVGTKRPIAIQLNNFKSVSNQSGIGQADIVYECIVEGGITRLLGIGESFSGDRLGSVRSSRHYFVSIADEYDAIYVHYGKTKYATKKMNELKIDHMDGSEGIGTTVFYRDKSIKAPNNAFASLESIQAGIAKKGFETNYASDFQPHYTFYEKDTDLEGGNQAMKLSLHFSGYTTPYFEYNETDKSYYRFQFNDKHVDSLTNQQLSFKNIIVQFVKEWDIDKNDYQTMDIEDASGNGFYITNGKKVDITWTKNEQTKKMRYLDASGNVLKMNQGKTFIVIFPNNQTSNITLSDSISNE